MNGKSKPYAILVFGAPMSGKTTFAKQFSQRFNAPFLNINELYEQYKISRKQTIIVEGGLNTEKQRNEMKKLLTDAGYSPVLIWIQTDTSAIKHRMRHKFKTVAEAKAALEASYKKLEAPAESENPLVISGKHTFQTQCKNVLTGISERKTVRIK